MHSPLPDPTAPLVPTWNGPVHAPFAAAARQYPLRVAVRDQHTAWTYQELDAYSNQLANYLRGRGIARQDVVAVYGYRSVELVWALLGILKAGAAFAVLDSAYPAHRTAATLRAMSAKGWLTVRGGGTPGQPIRAALDASGPVCELELCAAEVRAGDGPWKGCSDEPLDVAVNPEELAYLLFTSGTTGTPKGICGEHRPLPHFIEWHCRTFGFTPGSRFGMLSGVAHDPLLRDVFTPLAVGASLIIPPKEMIVQPDRLRAWLRNEEIGVVHITPALAQMLAQPPVEDRAEPALPDLRYAFFGGDRLTTKTVAALRTLAPSVTCVNFYGCTETPQAMGYHVLPTTESAESHSASEQIPLGKGIADVQLLVLTDAQQLASVGEIGEIHVRTPYLTRGYLGDESRTRERYVTNPFTGAPSDRLYKTGDLGRYRADGTVEFCRRADGQLKINGFRVEPDEVESTLVRHPGIRQGVVVAVPDGTGEAQLVAYWIPASSSDLSGSDLRAYLLDRLPPQMVPARFVRVESLPLTPNAKVDRRALLRPEWLGAERRSVAPARDRVEAQLVAIWEEVLRQSPIGVEDSFFDLGGSSLQVAQMFAAVARAFGKSYPLPTLFQAPTVAQLAQIVRRDDWSASWSSLVEIQAGGARPPLYCVHAQGGNVLSFIPLVRCLGPDQPVYGLQAQGLNEEQAPHTTIEAMAEHYVREIRSFQPEGPYLLAGFSFGGAVAFEMAQQLHRQGQRVALLALLDTSFPGWRPSFRARLAGHVRRFLALGAREKVAYVSQQVWGRGVKLIKKFRRRPAPVPVRFDAVPPLVRRVTQLNIEAKKRYKPQPYPGRVTIFRARERSVWNDEDMRRTWGPVVAGGLEVFDVPGSHETFHEREGQVQVLAEQLKACLERARVEGQPTDGNEVAVGTRATWGTETVEEAGDYTPLEPVDRV